MVLSEFIKKVFRKTTKSSKKDKANATQKSTIGKKQEHITEGATLSFALEDVTLPFVGDIRQLEGMPHVNRGTVRLEAKLESGTFGEVWKGVWCQGELQTKVAIKFFVPKYDTAKQERKILNHLQWRNTNGANDCIVKLIGCGSYAEHDFVVLEFVEGDCLDVLCTANKFQDMAMTKEIFLNLAKAVKSLHDRKVVHRDIKAENVIVCRSTRKVKLIDFGCSLLFSEKPFPAGTSPYVAPEVWKAIRTNPDEVLEREGGMYVEKSDIFSFGILMWTCLTGCLPFHDKPLHEVKRRITSGHLPPMDFQKWPTDLVDIMLCCMELNADDRLDAAQLVNRLQLFNPERC